MLTVAGADIWETSTVNDGHIASMLRLFPPTLKHSDCVSMIGVSVLIRGHLQIERILTKQGFIQWYTTIRLTTAYMDTTINGATLYENAFEKLFNRCMYVILIFYLHDHDEYIQRKHRSLLNQNKN